MKASELMEQLIGLSGEKAGRHRRYLQGRRPPSGDKKVALCCIATPHILRDAHRWGADLLITHEPTYHDNFDYLTPDDPVAIEKQKLVQATGMTIYRYHDHAHSQLPDAIAMGELEQLGWEKERFDGRHTLVLNRPRTVRELAEEIEEKLGIPHVRMAGDTRMTVKTICLCVGAWDMFSIMKQHDAELYICGELCEWQACEYIRDAAELGHRKALLVLGHIASEKAGMKYVEKLVRQIVPGIETRYFDNPNVFSYSK